MNNFFYAVNKRKRVYIQELKIEKILFHTFLYRKLKTSCVTVLRVLSNAQGGPRRGKGNPLITFVLSFIRQELRMCLKTSNVHENSESVYIFPLALRNSDDEGKRVKCPFLA